MLVAYSSNARQIYVDDIYYAVCHKKRSTLIFRYKTKYIQNQDFQSYMGETVLLAYVDKISGKRVPVRKAKIINVIEDKNIGIVNFVFMLEENLTQKYTFLEESNIMKDNFYFWNENIKVEKEEIAWVDTVSALQKISPEFAQLPFISSNTNENYDPFEDYLMVSFKNNEKCNWSVYVSANWSLHRVNKDIDVHTLFIRKTEIENEDGDGKTYERVFIRVYWENSKYYDIPINYSN